MNYSNCKWILFYNLNESNLEIVPTWLNSFLPQMPSTLAFSNIKDWTKLVFAIRAATSDLKVHRRLVLSTSNHWVLKCKMRNWTATGRARISDLSWQSSRWCYTYRSRINWSLLMMKIVSDWSTQFRVLKMWCCFPINDIAYNHGIISIRWGGKNFVINCFFPYLRN